jgi:hypothetical protein
VERRMRMSTTRRRMGRLWRRWRAMAGGSEWDGDGMDRPSGGGRGYKAGEPDDVRWDHGTVAARRLRFCIAGHGRD